MAKEKVSQDLAQPIAESIITPTPVPTIVPDHDKSVTTSVFVPYWTVGVGDNSNLSYDEYIYFGIAPTTNGIDLHEAGAVRVEKFLETIPQGKKKLVTLRMINAQTNAAILKDKNSQKKIITQTVAFAKDHEFSGVVLDLEISAIPFDSLVEQINDFTRDLATDAKKQNLTFSLTLYGDTFYRLRPFDVKTLSQNADSVMLMAYDFHKARANPGPNFPLSGRKTYGYDIEKMADDVLRFVPPNKVSVIFGLFGYDWEVDENEKAIAQGKPLTYQQIKEKFLDTCRFDNCQIKRDPVSSETVIRYTDEQSKKHVVWFEDMESVTAKENVLRKKGISHFSFWAYSYF